MAARPTHATAATLTSWLLLAVPVQAQSPAELQGYQQRLQQLFQRLDQNGDQRLERQEVNGQPYLQRHFERLDQQQRGYLTPADLRPAADSERARRLFSQADRTGDGRINREEAEGYPWLQRRFGEADRNNDGTVSRDELRQLRRYPPAAAPR